MQKPGWGPESLAPEPCDRRLTLVGFGRPTEIPVQRPVSSRGAGTRGCSGPPCQVVCRGPAVPELQGFGEHWLLPFTSPNRVGAPLAGT